MNFTATLWQHIAPTYQAILRHPFLTRLADGTLPEAAFRFYIIQDALYLRDFARGVALLAARAPHDDWLITFANSAAQAITVERSLHTGFLQQWNLPPEETALTPQAPACHHYTSFLLRSAHEAPFPEALGAFLPCYWIYLEVGKHLQSAGSPHPLYQRWINTYASPEFEAVVTHVRSIMDTAALHLPPHQQNAITHRFTTASRLEWQFWDMALHQQQWPV